MIFVSKYLHFNPIQDGGRGEKVPYQFFPCNFYKRRVILRRPRVVIFAEIIKIVNMFIKTITKDSRKVKRIMLKEYIKRIKLCIKIQSVWVFLDVAKFAHFR